MSTKTEVVTPEQLEKDCPGLKFTDISASDSARIKKDEEDLLVVESKVCSQGDTVHYAERPTFF